jgi:hypothetical protein
MMGSALIDGAFNLPALSLQNKLRDNAGTDADGLDHTESHDNKREQQVPIANNYYSTRQSNRRI